MRIVDEVVDGFGWIQDEPAQRASHALAVDGRVWLFDVVDGPEVDDRVRELGEPAGVVQLLDRHNRDCAAVARRLGVPHHRVPRELPGTPFQLRWIVRLRVWREVALWWEERKLLLVADALGTIPFFCAGAEPAGVHPFLRVWPPRSLRGLEPEHLLVGHGEGIHHHPLALGSALRTARRRLPRLVLELPRELRRSS
jgi:hypothetical protein